MRKVSSLILSVCFLAGFASLAGAIRWPDNMSYRVETMGGATMGIEDEVTTLDLFNHENPAGLMFGKQMNRMDMGASYAGDTVKYDVGPGTQIKIESTDMELTRPGGEYRGVMYYLANNLMIRGGVEGLLMNTKVSLPGETHNLNFNGLGAGLGMGYRTDFGLSLGAGFSYKGAGGQADDVSGMFDILAPYGATTNKFAYTANNLDWVVAAGYIFENLCGGNLTLGATVSHGDDLPDTTALANPSSLPDPLILGDYNLALDVAGAVTPLPGISLALEQKSQWTVTPMVVAGEIIYDYASWLHAGVLLDSRTKEVKLKQESVIPILGTITTDQKVASENLLGITPMVRMTLPLMEGTNGLVGVQYSTWGSGTADGFGNTTGAKETSAKLIDSMFKLGLGLQTLNKTLNLGVQYEAGSNKTDTTQYNIYSGSTLGTGTTEDVISNLRLGAEFWLMPTLAVRAGYALLGTVTKVAATPDKTDKLSRITFGAGLAMADNTAVDLLVKLDNETFDPNSNNKTHTNTGVYLGLRLAL